MAWRKPPSGPLTEHFTWVETVCRHCGMIPDAQVIRETAEWMEKVRAALGGHVIHVNSWCRCPTHNAAVGGASQSLHMAGWAVDITVRGLSPSQVHTRLAKLQGPKKLIGGLGKYISFTHVDRGPARRWNGP